MIRKSSIHLRRFHLLQIEQQKNESHGPLRARRGMWTLLNTWQVNNKFMIKLNIFRHVNLEHEWFRCHTLARLAVLCNVLEKALYILVVLFRSGPLKKIAQFLRDWMSKPAMYLQKICSTEKSD